MKMKHASRWLTLSWFLKTEVPRKKYNQNRYGRLNENHPSIENRTEDQVCEMTRPDEICGTAACALGWSTVIWPRTWQLRFALGWKHYSANVLFKGVEVDIEDPDSASKSACEWWGVDNATIRDMFGIGNYTPKQKARQIEQMVAEYGYTYVEAT